MVHSRRLRKSRLHFICFVHVRCVDSPVYGGSVDSSLPSTRIKTVSSAILHKVGFWKPSVRDSKFYLDAVSASPQDSHVVLSSWSFYDPQYLSFMVLEHLPFHGKRDCCDACVCLSWTKSSNGTTQTKEEKEAAVQVQEALETVSSPQASISFGIAVLLPCRESTRENFRSNKAGTPTSSPREASALPP